MSSSVVQIIDVSLNPTGVSSDGTNVWVTNNSSNTVSKIDILTGIVVQSISVGTNPTGISSDGTNVWVANFNDNSVSKISIASGTVVQTITTLIGTNPRGISSDGTNVWVANAGSNNVSKISIASGTVVQRINVQINPRSISSDGTNVWVANATSASVSKINILTNSVVQTITVGTNPSGISSDGTNVWVSNFTSNTVSKISIATGTIVQTITVGTSPRGISSDGTYVWVANSTTNNVSKILISPLPCFKEGTKILTDQGYRAIEDLRKGDLVKTLKHDYLPVVILGKSEIVHNVSKERIKNQLYECTNNKYPEIFEPLIMSGCHSILVDWLTQEQGEKTMEDFGLIYETDGKPRLCAYLDEKANVYEVPGTYTIYHLALENDDYYGNYGIYANGLLVESCSKRYLLEHSNMELLSTF